MGPEELVLGPDGQLKIQGDKSSSLVQSPAEGDLEASEVFEHVKVGEVVGVVGVAEVFGVVGIIGVVRKVSQVGRSCWFCL